MGITEKILYFFGYVKIPEQAIRITENIKYLLDRLEQADIVTGKQIGRAHV